MFYVKREDISVFNTFYAKHGKFSLKDVDIRYDYIPKFKRYAIIINNTLDTAENMKNMLIDFASFPAGMIHILKPQ